MNKIKVLYITDLVGLGGGETSLLNHLDHLDHQRFSPLVLCAKKGALTEALKERGIRTEITLFEKTTRIFGPILRYPLISSLRIASFLKKESIDIVNANTFDAMAVMAPGARFMGVPILWTCHGWWPVGRPSGIFINAFANRVIAVSDFVENKLRKEGHVNPSKIVKIPLGIDPKKYISNNASRQALRREFGIPDGMPLIGMIGRFQRIKGHHIFVETAQKVLKIRPDACFLLVGAKAFGSQEESDYYEEVMGMIRGAGLENKIILTGFRQDIPEILGAIDLLLITSETETFGMVVLESMAMGTPVISCAKGGPEEIIDNGRTGVLIKGQDTVELARNVVYLLKNPDIRFKMGAQGREAVSARYDIGHIQKETEALYEKVLSADREIY
jgi:glycosyltransferase involved in cell wall biosynthesis